MAEERGPGPPAPAGGALAELARCETLAQKASWAARWSARASGADVALVFCFDPLGPHLACSGAWGEGASAALRRTVPKGTGLAWELLRKRTSRAFSPPEVAGSTDPLLSLLPAGSGSAIAAPLLVDKGAAGVVVLAFRGGTGGALERLEGFLADAAAVLDRASGADRRSRDHLAAIERLTSLYDVQKAFGSTIDLSELGTLVARKAADLSGGEAASLWMYDASGEELTLAATAANETYGVTPPESVGAGVVGDVLASREPVLLNGLAPEDPRGGGDEAFPVRSLLAVPLVEEELPVGVVAVANRRGRRHEFVPGDEELLADLARAAVHAIRNARRYEAEKKVAELDALLAVSREITSTLDLDRVLKAIVNATSALVTHDRCTIAILARGRLRVGAVSGVVDIDRSDPSIRRVEALLEWVYHGGSAVAVTRREDGTIDTDRPATEEKFRAFFDESGWHAFYGVLLEDDEGKLGVLGFECREPLAFDHETRDLLQILVNQATVAVRNAQLYGQVPLPGFLRPLADRTRRVTNLPASRRWSWAAASLALLLVLFLVPWKVRVPGRALVVPGRRVPVSVPVEGVVESVLHREGDVVAKGTLLGTLRDDAFRAALAEAEAAREIAEAEAAKARASGSAAEAFGAEAKREEARARAAWAAARLEGTRLRAPEGGVVLTPHIERSVGRLLAAGTEFATLADPSAAAVEVALPEEEVSLLSAGQPVDVKLNAYPGRTFHGSLSRLGAAVHEEGGERFVLAEARVSDASLLLRPGMAGKAKVVGASRRLAWALFRRPARWLAAKAWPLLP